MFQQEKYESIEESAEGSQRLESKSYVNSPPFFNKSGIRVNDRAPAREGGRSRVVLGTAFPLPQKTQHVRTL